MTLIVPNAGEEKMLDLILAVNMQLKLYQNDVTAGLTYTQKDALTESSFTEATFTGYSAKSLTGGSWTTTQATPSTGTYAQQTFTRTATGADQTIYGYYVVRASDGALMWFEDFVGPVITNTNGDTIRITPTITLDDDQEAEVAARGLIASQVLTTSSAGYTSDTTTDFALSNVDVDSTRNYAIILASPYALSGTARWLVQVYVDGVNTVRVADLNNTAAGSLDSFLSAVLLWQPSTGNVDLDVRVDEISGTATLSFGAASTAPRQFWVEDIGPR